MNQSSKKQWTILQDCFIFINNQIKWILSNIRQSLLMILLQNHQCISLHQYISFCNRNNFFLKKLSQFLNSCFLIFTGGFIAKSYGSNLWKLLVVFNLVADSCLSLLLFVWNWISSCDWPYIYRRAILI